jgi:hypothetical protein
MAISTNLIEQLTASSLSMAELTENNPKLQAVLLKIKDDTKPEMQSTLDETSHTKFTKK